MGSKKITTIDMSTQEDKKSSKKTTKKSPKANSLVPSDPSVSLVIQNPSKTQSDSQETLKPTKPIQKKIRSKRYTSARAQVDKTKTYPLSKAISLVKKLSSPKHPTITADINLTAKDSFDIAFPHPTGKTIRVAIATPALLKKVGAGKTDFDLLLAQPDQMKDIAKLAKILGPKGLMPNPKNRTITNDPKKRKKELQVGKTTLKCETKAPIIHCQIGTTQMTNKQIEENLSTLIKTLNPANISRLTLSSTMSPGIKIDLQQTTQLQNA